MKKRNWKSITCIAGIAVMLLVLTTGCVKTTTLMSYVYKVDTGDKIKMSIETNDGYKISSDVPFVISKDGEEISSGTFIDADYYDDYANIASTDLKAELLDQGERDNLTYTMWCYDDSEYNYVIKIGGTNTGILLGNLISEESAKECFNKLTIEAD